MRTQKSKAHCRKITALGALSFFLLQQVLPSNTFAFSDHPASLSSAAAIEIPKEIGSLEEINLKDKNAPVIVHIQNAHGNYEAQKNIQALLSRLTNQHDYKTLFLEGANDKLHPEFFRFFPDAEINLKVADSLARKAELTGPELFLIERDQHVMNGVTAYGIESAEAYRANRKAFQEVLRAGEKTETFLGDMDMQIERLTSPYLNTALKNYLRRLEIHEVQNHDMIVWVRFLKGQAAKHLEIDLEDAFHQKEWPMLVRFVRLEKIEKSMGRSEIEKEKVSFLEKLIELKIDSGLIQKVQALLKPSSDQNASQKPSYLEILDILGSVAAELPKDFSFTPYQNLKYFMQSLILEHELSGAAAMDEIERLESRLGEKLAQTETEKKLWVLFKDYRLLKKLFALELTKKDYEAMSRDRSRALPSQIAKNFEEINKNKRVRNIRFSHLDEIDRLFDLALNFYKGAVERDGIMADNLLKQMTALKENKAILVTGGFHSEGMKQYFESKGFSYYLVSPRISEAGDTRAYRAAMLESNPVFKKSQIENIAKLLTQDNIIAEGGTESLAHIQSVLQQTLTAAVPSDILATLNAASLEKNYGVSMETSRAEVRSVSFAIRTILLYTTLVGVFYAAQESKVSAQPPAQTEQTASFQEAKDVIKASSSLPPSLWDLERRTNQLAYKMKMELSTPQLAKRMDPRDSRDELKGLILDYSALKKSGVAKDNPDQQTMLQIWASPIPDILKLLKSVETRKISGPQTIEELAKIQKAFSDLKRTQPSAAIFHALKIQVLQKTFENQQKDRLTAIEEKIKAEKVSQKQAANELRQFRINQQQSNIIHDMIGDEIWELDGLKSPSSSSSLKRIPSAAAVILSRQWGTPFLSGDETAALIQDMLSEEQVKHLEDLKTNLRFSPQPVLWNIQRKSVQLALKMKTDLSMPQTSKNMEPQNVRDEIKLLIAAYAVVNKSGVLKDAPDQQGVLKVWTQSIPDTVKLLNNISRRKITAAQAIEDLGKIHANYSEIMESQEKKRKEPLPFSLVPQPGSAVYHAIRIQALQKVFENQQRDQLAAIEEKISTGKISQKQASEELQQFRINRQAPNILHDMITDEIWGLDGRQRPGSSSPFKGIPSAGAVIVSRQWGTPFLSGDETAALIKKMTPKRVESGALPRSEVRGQYVKPRVESLEQRDVPASTIDPLAALLGQASYVQPLNSASVLGGADTYGEDLPYLIANSQTSNAAPIDWNERPYQSSLLPLSAGLQNIDFNGIDPFLLEEPAGISVYPNSLIPTEIHLKPISGKIEDWKEHAWDPSNQAEMTRRLEIAKRIIAPFIQATGLDPQEFRFWYDLDREKLGLSPAGGFVAYPNGPGQGTVAYTFLTEEEANFPLPGLFASPTAPSPSPDDRLYTMTHIIRMDLRRKINHSPLGLEIRIKYAVENEIATPVQITRRTGLSSSDEFLFQALPEPAVETFDITPGNLAEAEQKYTSWAKAMVFPPLANLDHRGTDILRRGLAGQANISAGPAQFIMDQIFNQPDGGKAVFHIPVKVGQTIHPIKQTIVSYQPLYANHYGWHITFEDSLTGKSASFLLYQSVRVSEGREKYLFRRSILMIDPNGNISEVANLFPETQKEKLSGVLRQMLGLEDSPAGSDFTEHIRNSFQSARERLLSFFSNIQIDPIANVPSPDVNFAERGDLPFQYRMQLNAMIQNHPAKIEISLRPSGEIVSIRILNPNNPDQEMGVELDVVEAFMRLYAKDRGLYEVYNRWDGNTPSAGEKTLADAIWERMQTKKSLYDLTYGWVDHVGPGGIITLVGKKEEITEWQFTNTKFAIEQLLKDAHPDVLKSLANMANTNLLRIALTGQNQIGPGIPELESLGFVTPPGVLGVAFPDTRNGRFYGFSVVRVLQPHHFQPSYEWLAPFYNFHVTTHELSHLFHAAVPGGLDNSTIINLANDAVIHRGLFKDTYAGSLGVEIIPGPDGYPIGHRLISNHPEWFAEMMTFSKDAGYPEPLIDFDRPYNRALLTQYYSPAVGNLTSHLTNFSVKDVWHPSLNPELMSVPDLRQMLLYALSDDGHGVQLKSISGTPEIETLPTPPFLGAKELRRFKGMKGEFQVAIPGYAPADWEFSVSRTTDYFGENGVTLTLSNDKTTIKIFRGFKDTADTNDGGKWQWELISEDTTLSLADLDNDVLRSMKLGELLRRASETYLLPVEAAPAPAPAAPIKENKKVSKELPAGIPNLPQAIPNTAITGPLNTQQPILMIRVDASGVTREIIPGTGDPLHALTQGGSSAAPQTHGAASFLEELFPAGRVIQTRNPREVIIVNEQGIIRGRLTPDAQNPNHVEIELVSPINNIRIIINVLNGNILQIEGENVSDLNREEQLQRLNRALTAPAKPIQDKVSALSSLLLGAALSVKPKQKNEEENGAVSIKNIRSEIRKIEAITKWIMDGIVPVVFLAASVIASAGEALASAASHVYQQLNHVRLEVEANDVPFQPEQEKIDAANKKFFPGISSAKSGYLLGTDTGIGNDNALAVIRHIIKDGPIAIMVRTEAERLIVEKFNKSLRSEARILAVSSVEEAKIELGKRLTALGRDPKSIQAIVNKVDAARLKKDLLLEGFSIQDIKAGAFGAYMQMANLEFAARLLIEIKAQIKLAQAA